MADNSEPVNGINGAGGAAHAINGNKDAPENMPALEGGTGEAPAAEADDAPFSWLRPHPIFVIALIGKEETPFGIQKDFLVSKSAFYKKYFTENPQTELENVVNLPDTPVEVFAFAQNFLYTGQVCPSPDNLPSYDVLIGVWKLGHDLGIEGLCDATLAAMAECRRITQHIPATPLLVQVWKDTPEGSSIRKLLLSWAAEYMRSSDSRAEFARSLPQEVLSELVVAMSSLDTTPVVQVNAAREEGPALAAPAPPPPPAPVPARRVHYIETDEKDEELTRPPAKKQRHSDVLPNGSGLLASKPPAKKPGPRVSLPSAKPVVKRRSSAFLGDAKFSTDKKLNFCADLLTRMLSGPGFWTRLVGPFKEPVDPVSDGVPDYLTKVQRPMDLGTMKAKMDRREYADETEFLADMNQIFSNCYAYWSKKDPMWGACERLQKTFEEKYSQMNKWISKMEGDEGSH